MIQKGDALQIRPEWRDSGEGHIYCEALEDEDKGSVLIELRTGLHQYEPVERVLVTMVEPWKEEE